MTIRIPTCLAAAALLASAMALAAPSRTAETVATDTPAAGSAADGLAFAASLEACVAASHRSPHPFVSGFVIEHEIIGLEGELCSYSQTMPGQMRMECKLGSAGRNGLATEFREAAAGRLGGGTGEQPAWTSDCEIVTAEGKRLPLGKG